MLCDTVVAEDLQPSRFPSSHRWLRRRFTVLFGYLKHRTLKCCSLYLLPEATPPPALYDRSLLVENIDDDISLEEDKMQKIQINTYKASTANSLLEPSELGGSLKYRRPSRLWLARRRTGNSQVLPPLIIPTRSVTMA